MSKAKSTCIYDYKRLTSFVYGLGTNYRLALSCKVKHVAENAERIRKLGLFLRV